MSSFTIVTSQITRNLTTIEFSLHNYVVDTSVDIHVRVLDDTGTLCSVHNLTMSGTDFTNWGNTNTNLYNYICAQLGYTFSSAP